MGPEGIKKRLVIEFPIAIVISASLDRISLGSNPYIVVIKFRCDFISQFSNKY
jgi:hypothetical protein